MAMQTVLLKPASGLCNMKCSYCFYMDEMKERAEGFYGMMTEETLKRITKKVLFHAGGQVCFAFQGGEPTLRGIDFYKTALDYQYRFNRNSVPILNTIQTNGFTLNEEWCRFFSDNDFLVGVSVDGLESIHDRYRRTPSGEPTYSRVVEGIRLLEEYGVEYNILTVVTRQVSENIKEIYEEYRRNGWKYQQYIACLDPFSCEAGQMDYSLEPEQYGRFLTELFRLWEKDWRKGRAPYIRQFENYVGILLGCPPEACEQRGVCSVQCVAESDGRAYPCDFYALDEYCIGSYRENTPEEMAASPIARRFVEESLLVSEECVKCRWYNLCRNGCRRHRQGEAGGKNRFCSGYKIFFENCGERLEEIARYVGH